MAKIQGEHALALDLYNRQPDISVVLATAGYYRLDLNRAEKIISDTGKVIAGWKTRARKLGLSAHAVAEAEHLFLSLNH